MSITRDVPTSKHILLTGAAGRIGTAFRQYIGDRYRLRLGVHHLDKLGNPGSHQAIELEIADLDACQAACEGIDVVIHLAGSPSPRADFYETLLDSNIKGTYNILQAASDQGCQRVVLASSVQAVVGYPLDVQVRPDSPVRPLNMYGVCKCFGEAAAHYFSCAHGLSCIAVRIGTFEGQWVERQPHARNMSTFVSQRDMSQLLVRCVEEPDVQFAIVHGVSDNRFKYLDITSTRELLGYEPQDDAFALLGPDIAYSEQWVARSLGCGTFFTARKPEGQSGGKENDIANSP